MTAVSVSELRGKENHRNQMISGRGTRHRFFWRMTTFDAWTTRHAITTQGAQELDPLLKPLRGQRLFVRGDSG